MTLFDCLHQERPDVNHHLKFTYGVNAWKHWVVGKNADIEKERAQVQFLYVFIFHV